MSDDEGEGRRGRFESERGKRERSASPQDEPKRRRREGGGGGGGGGYGGGGGGGYGGRHRGGGGGRGRRGGRWGGGGGHWGGGGGGWGGRGGGRGGWRGPPQPAAPVKMPYKEFLGRQPDDITPEEAQKRYDKYGEEFEQGLVRAYFDRNKDSSWVREKYNPLAMQKMRESAPTRPAESAATFAEAFDANDPASWPSYAYTGPDPKTPEEQAAEAEKAAEEKAAAEKEAEEKADGGDGEEEGEAKPVDLDKPLEPEKAAVDPDSPAGLAQRTLFAPALPRSLTRNEAIELFANENGYVEVHAPFDVDPQRLTRRMWATYATKDDAEKAQRALDRKLVHPVAGERLQVHICAVRRWPPMPKLRLVPPNGAEEERCALRLPTERPPTAPADTRAGAAPGWRTTCRSRRA